MKGFVKSIIELFGYVVVTKKHYQKLEEGPHIPDLDFFYLVKGIIAKNSAICCFDIGANVGQTSRKLKTYFPNAKIYMFEPVKATFDLLTQNSADFDNLILNNEAMGSKVGEGKIFHRVNSQWNSLVEELNQTAEMEGASAEVIKINTIDNFVEQNGIDRIHFLKSDTEGFELDVLRGAKRTLSYQIIDLLYVEVGFEKKDKQHTYFGDVVEFLEGYGYFFCGLFESSYGLDKKLYYANALFMSEERSELNRKSGKKYSTYG